MAITFPLPVASLQGAFGLVSGSGFTLDRAAIYSGTGGGQVLVSEVGPAFWRARLSFVPMSYGDAAALRSVLETLGRPEATFYLFDPTKPYPRLDPTGSVLGASTPTIHTIGADNKSMRLEGLPVGYALSPGDYLAFNYGSSKRALHRLAESAVADGGGVTASFEIVPHIRSGATVGAAVTLAQAAGKFRLSPQDLMPGNIVGNHVVGAGFAAIQVP